MEALTECQAGIRSPRLGARLDASQEVLRRRSNTARIAALVGEVSPLPTGDVSLCCCGMLRLILLLNPLF
jgi:hypothetical protein